MENKGLFIAIEGTDGSGKATQTKLLQDRIIDDFGCNFSTISLISLPKYDSPSCFLVDEYKKGIFGPMLEVSPKKAAFCFAADRFHASLNVKLWLSWGRVVIADRWTASNYAHQGAKCVDQMIGFACVDTICWIGELEHNQLEIPKPQLNIILDVLPETSAKLLEKDGKTLDGHEQSLSYQQKVRKVYLWLAENNPDKYKVVQCCNVAGDILPEKEIHEKVWETVEPLL